MTTRQLNWKHIENGLSVFLWYPNVVGYGRIVSTIFAFAFCFTHHKTAAFFYLVGQGLDAIDGVTARYFNQCSKFGAVLDMLTDRMSTASLLVVLSHLYPDAWGFFCFLIVLDVVSHWFQMYAKLALRHNSHKGSKNPLLNFYYTFPFALLVFCVGNEFFLVSLYLLAFWGKTAATAGILNAVLYICAPIFIGKQFMNFVQLYDAANEIVDLDELEQRALYEASKAKAQ